MLAAVLVATARLKLITVLDNKNKSKSNLTEFTISTLLN